MVLWKWKVLDFGLQPRRGLLFPKIPNNLSNDDTVEEEDEVNSLNFTYWGPFLSAQGNKAKVKSKEVKLQQESGDS